MKRDFERKTKIKMSSCPHYTRLSYHIHALCYVLFLGIPCITFGSQLSNKIKVFYHMLHKFRQVEAKKYSGFWFCLACAMHTLKETIIFISLWTEKSRKPTTLVYQHVGPASNDKCLVGDCVKEGH